jgi:hypothetical protein
MRACGRVNLIFVMHTMTVPDASGSDFAPAATIGRNLCRPLPIPLAMQTARRDVSANIYGVSDDGLVARRGGLSDLSAQLSGQ